MNAKRNAFHYAPAALLTKHAWEIQWLALDAARTLKILEDKRARMRETQSHIGSVVDELRTLYQAPQGISLERRGVLQAYLDQQRQLEVSQAKEAAQAELVYAQLMRQLQSQRTSQRIIEKHRSRKRYAWEQEDRMSEFKEADDAWLLTERGGRR